MKLCLLLVLALATLVRTFLPSATTRLQHSTRLSSSNNNDNDNAAEMKRKAEELRQQIRDMEAQLGSTNRRQYDVPAPTTTTTTTISNPLDNKTVLVTGANGRLGSMVCRYLLRNFPKTKVVAAVHIVGESSTRGYGRLSYEVGAEDGVGSIGPAWEMQNAQFEYDREIMGDYNLQNIRVVECELLDPLQCQTIAQGCDAMIWCATDFNGNRPRAISSLNVAFLFRAVTRPDKGRVEVEGLQNMLGGMKLAQSTNDARHANVVLVSTAPDAYDDFETPFGSFKGIKRRGEEVLMQDFPSLSHVILQLGRFDDNFVEEGLDVQYEKSKKNDAEAPEDQSKAKRKINRRDAAKAAVDALVNAELKGQTVQAWTAMR